MVRKANKRIKPSNYIIELYMMHLMDGKPLEEIALKVMDYATDKQLFFPFESHRKIAFFIFKHYNGDIRKLLE